LIANSHIIISVASGKGGTGKTTVATNLAVTLGPGVQLLDCDVEEPNAHLFINPSIEQVETVTTPVPEVDEKKCTLCKKCVPSPTPIDLPSSTPHPGLHVRSSLP